MQLLADVLLLWMNKKQSCNCHRCRTQICLCRKANMVTKQDREKRKQRLRWSIPLLMITWSHTYRTKHLNRWIMGPSPPLQQNHPLHLPLDVSLSFSPSPPSPPPHHSFFMFVRVSNRERHTITRLLSLMVWSEAHSSHRLYTCMCDCEFCYRGSMVHECSPGTPPPPPKKHLTLWPLTAQWVTFTLLSKGRGTKVN